MLESLLRPAVYKTLRVFRMRGLYDLAAILSLLDDLGATLCNHVETLAVDTLTCYLIAVD